MAEEVVKAKPDVQPEEPKAQYHVVVVCDSDRPKIMSFEVKSMFEGFITELLRNPPDESVWLYGFYGSRVELSSPRLAMSINYANGKTTVLEELETAPKSQDTALLQFPNALDIRQKEIQITKET